MFFHVVHQKAGEGVVGLMAWLVDGEVCVEHTSCQPHVTHEVEQLVACRLIWVIGVGGIEHTVVYLEVVDVLVEDFAEEIRKKYDLGSDK